MIQEHLNKNNLHHAYLIEGKHEKIVPEILEFIEILGVKTSGNPDFSQMIFDNLKIEDALFLRNMSLEKGISEKKKIFIICVNSFTLDAEQTLLKMFEEPIENTHFFLVIPDVHTLLPTVISTFYLISSRQDLAENENLKEVENFIAMPLQNRINFLKEFLAETEDGEEDLVEMPLVTPSTKFESPRIKALKFLNMLEFKLYYNFIPSLTWNKIDYFEHIFKVREFLRQPGSSAKNLMEGVALIIPKMLY